MATQKKFVKTSFEDQREPKGGGRDREERYQEKDRDSNSNNHYYRPNNYSNNYNYNNNRKPQGQYKNNGSFSNYNNSYNKDSSGGHNYTYSKDRDRDRQRERDNRDTRDISYGPDLRKYFEIVAASNPDVDALIKKLPGFFVQLSLHPEPPLSKNFKTKSDGSFSKENSNAFGNFRSAQPVEIPVEEEDPGWESEGEVQLGTKIQSEKFQKFADVKPIDFGQLKRHEIEFLEQELRNKKVQEEEQKQQEPQRVLEAVAQKPGMMQVDEPSASSSGSDSESDVSDADSEKDVEIAKVTYNPAPQEIPVAVQLREERKVEEEFDIDDIPDDEDDDKFRDSSEHSDGSDDDIFGEGSSENLKTEEDESNTATTIGKVHYAQGEFSLFAINNGFSADAPLWRVSNGTNYSDLITSRDMDNLFVSQYQEHYPDIGFGDFKRFVKLQELRANPTIHLFKKAVGMGNNYYHNHHNQHHNHQNQHHHNHHHQQHQGQGQHSGGNKVGWYREKKTNQQQQK